MAAEHNVDISDDSRERIGWAGHQERHPEPPRKRGSRAADQQGPGCAIAHQLRSRLGLARPPAAVPTAPLVDTWPGDRVEPWSRIRKLTADHMVMSRRVSPHVNTIFEIDYTHVVQLRAAKKKEYAERGVNLTYLAFIAKVVADNLRKHPVLNSAVSGESTLLPPRYQHRHRGGARLGADRPGDQARRRALAAGHRPGHQRPR